MKSLTIQGYKDHNFIVPMIRKCSSVYNYIELQLKIMTIEIVEMIDYEILQEAINEGKKWS